LTSLQRLSYNAKRATVKGIAAGVITLLAYLLVVVVTTPSLPALSAIRAAFAINTIIIVGVAVAVGIQVFSSSYSRSRGCAIGNRKTLGAGAGGTAIGSFFSFFSLVPLGCCGSWLLILSFLPSIFGGTLSVFLVNYSEPLSYVSLAAVTGFAVLSVLRLRKRLKGMAR
jgi:hypothetical protein